MLPGSSRPGRKTLPASRGAAAAINTGDLVCGDTRTRRGLSRHSARRSATKRACEGFERPSAGEGRAPGALSTRIDGMRRDARFAIRRGLLDSRNRGGAILVSFVAIASISGSVRQWRVAAVLAASFSSPPRRARNAVISSGGKDGEQVNRSALLACKGASNPLFLTLEVLPEFSVHMRHEMICSC